jgi:hypothetical protein
MAARNSPDRSAVNTVFRARFRTSGGISFVPGLGHLLTKEVLDEVQTPLLKPEFQAA